MPSRVFLPAGRWASLCYTLAKLIYLPRRERSERLFPAARPPDRHRIDLLGWAESVMNARVVTCTIAIRPLHDAPLNPISDIDADRGADGIAAASIEHAKHDPIAAAAHGVTNRAQGTRHAEFVLGDRTFRRV